MSDVLLVSEAVSYYLILTDVEDQTTLNISVEGSPILNLIDSGIQGPAGGGTSAGPTKIDVSSAGTWIVPHGKSYIPTAEVYLTGGERVIADLVVDSTYVTVYFAQPSAGFLLIV